MLHIPAQRTRAELRIVGRVDDELFCSLRQLTTQLLVGQTAVERRDLQVDDICPRALLFSNLFISILWWSNVRF